MSSISFDKNSPQFINGDIKIIANATGKGELQYKFEVNKEGTSTFISEYILIIALHGFQLKSVLIL